jgi:hypothetical protein
MKRTRVMAGEPGPAGGCGEDRSGFEVQAARRRRRLQNGRGMGV